MTWTTRHHQLVGHPDSAARVMRGDRQMERCPTYRSERGTQGDGQPRRQHIGRHPILTTSQRCSAGTPRATRGLRRVNGTATLTRPRTQSSHPQPGGNRRRRGSRGPQLHVNPPNGPAQAHAVPPPQTLPHEEVEAPGSLPELQPRAKVLNGPKPTTHSPPTTICPSLQ